MDKLKKVHKEFLKQFIKMTNKIFYITDYKNIILVFFFSVMPFTLESQIDTLLIDSLATIRFEIIKNKLSNESDFYEKDMILFNEILNINDEIDTQFISSAKRAMQFCFTTPDDYSHRYQFSMCFAKKLESKIFKLKQTTDTFWTDSYRKEMFRFIYFSIWTNTTIKKQFINQDYYDFKSLITIMDKNQYKTLMTEIKKKNISKIYKIEPIRLDNGVILKMLLLDSSLNAYFLNTYLKGGLYSQIQRYKLSRAKKQRFLGSGYPPQEACRADEPPFISIQATEFPDGNEHLCNYLKNELSKHNFRDDSVMFSFVIDTQGRSQIHKYYSKISQPLESEINMIVKNIKRCKPGRLNIFRCMSLIKVKYFPKDTSIYIISYQLDKVMRVSEIINKISNRVNAKKYNFCQSDS